MNKLHLQHQVCARLEADLATLIAAAEAAHQAATHEESKAENKYDTRGLEASRPRTWQRGSRAEWPTSAEP